MTDLGGALRAAREAAGVSLAAMAARTHYSKPLLGLLETGKRTIKPEHVEAYSRALDVPIEILQGPPDDPLRVAHEWLVSDSPTVVQLRAGRRVGAALADELETRVVELRHLDDVIGGGDLFRSEQGTVRGSRGCPVRQLHRQGWAAAVDCDGRACPACWVGCQ